MISELEALGIVFGLHYFKYCIHGCDIIIVMDHSALVYLMDRNEPHSNHMYHWRMEIASFASCGGSLKFVYKPGAHHKVPDGLSCNPLPLDEVPPELTDNEQEQWVSAKAFVDDKNNPDRICEDGLAGSTFEEARAGDVDQPKGFQIPDIDSIAATVKKWQDDDPFVWMARSYILHKVMPLEPNMQAYLAMFGQQLELDDYRFCTDAVQINTDC